jgi:ribosomal protein S18 acetylase RimI-like enzyme
MFNFIRVRKSTDFLFSEFYDLYLSAFPISERRGLPLLEKTMMNDSFYVYATMYDEQFVGFVNFWTFERFTFIEHFAMLPHMRGQRIGTNLIRILQLQVKQPIILEVETPATKIAVRRIHFWERLGFYVLSNYYMQHPYDDSLFLIPMLIMSNDYHFANRHFQMIKNTLYNEVYHYLPEK